MQAIFVFLLWLCLQNISAVLLSVNGQTLEDRIGTELEDGLLQAFSALIKIM